MSKKMPTLSEFLAMGYTPYHVVAEVREILEQNGYTELAEGESWRLLPGGGYFFVRGGASLVAFRMPARTPRSYQLAIAHTDSPCFKIREAKADGEYIRLSVEKYGGMLCGTWFDRPLRVAGRVFVENGEKILEKRVCLDGNLLIPSVAIHHNPSANEKLLANVAVDLLPVFDQKKTALSFDEVLARAVGAENAVVLGKDLFLVSDSTPFLWGEGETLISSPRLDDLQSVYALLKGLLEAKDGGSVPVLALLNGEEVGSLGVEGADSDILSVFVKRVADASGKEADILPRLLASSFAISCDSAHAVHPAHPELADGGEGRCYINEGIVIKENAAKRYATDGFSEAMLRKLCQDASIPTQVYRNRADMPGGATLGCIALSHISVPMVDVGLATLAMHSAMETAGTTDTAHLAHAAARYFSATLIRDGESAFWQYEGEEQKK